MDTGSLAVFDVATGAQVDSIPLDSPDVGGIAILPDGSRAYVVDGPNVRVIDLATRAESEIPIPDVPRGIAAHPDGSRVYVTAEDADIGEPDKVHVIDTATNALRADSIEVGDRPRRIVLDAEGKRAYVGIAGPPAAISVINTETETEIDEILGDPGDFERPDNLAITPDGRTVYAANFGTNAGGTTVTVVDAQARDVVDQITVGTTPSGLDVDPSGARLYVAVRDDNLISVISTATNAVTGTIPFPPGVRPTDVHPTFDGARLVVAAFGENKVAVVDNAGQLIATPADVPDPTQIAIPPVQSPTAAFAAAVGAAGSPTIFDASASNAPLGAIARYDWTFGDGTAAADAGPAPSHVYAAPGSYPATLTVRNTCDPAAVFGPLNVASAGATAYCNGPPTASAARTVDVPAAAPQPPPPPLPPTPPQPPQPAPLRLTGLSIAPSAFRTARLTNTAVVARRRPRGPIGTRIRFTLSRPAIVRIRFTKVLARRSASARRPTTRRRPVRSLTRVARRSGAFSVRFTGRLAGSSLTPGRWRMTVVATAAGRTTPAQSRTFTVLRP